MRRRGIGNSCWPTPQQETLLRAALARGADARRAWAEWKSALDDSLDLASRRMLPLLYRNLKAEGVEDPLMERLKDAYLRNWSRNQLVFRHMAAVLRSLNDAGLKTLLLKGAPLVLLYYRDYGARAMADLDVLVPTEQALIALDLLKRNGWKRADPWPEILHESYISVGNAACFSDASGRQLDLHWHVLPECCREDADEDFWSRTIPVAFHGISTSTLDPADQLLHLCAHGVRWDPVPSFRWIADAVTLIRAEPRLDWGRVAQQAEKRRLVWPVREALSYLHNTFQAAVPNAALEELRGMRTSRLEYVEFRYKTRVQRTSLGYLPIHWFHYLRLKGTRGAKYNAIGFARYLQRLCGARSLSALAAYAAARRLRRTAERLQVKKRVVAAGR
jgi:Uncharacterised nucleotidyltransferase